MTRKSDNPKKNFIAVKVSDQELEWLNHLMRGCSNCSRSEIVRRSLKYAYDHPYQVLSADTKN